MKRIGHLYTQLYNIENLHLADKIASRGKSKQPGVIEHRKNQQQNIITLQNLLINRKFKTSEYYNFTIHEGKERCISSLPYYPDRILQHALFNIIEPIFVKTFTSNTYSCIKGRGIHLALRRLRKALRDVEGTTYCLKLDIKKFYPSVDNTTLKALLRRKFKDTDLLQLLDNIIDSNSGLPIGNLSSQYLANFYLTYFDHWLKEYKKVKYLYRYMDDIVILSNDKLWLHSLRQEITDYLLTNLKLEVKNNYQVFPVESRGIDFVGYKSYHTHTQLRKSIKKRFIKMIKSNKNSKSIASYNGWLVHCDSINLRNKYLN